jgi:2,4-dienoyl-CoA reductase-like NADH-dependent reductase (Old Yellow Enzyme family)
MADQFTHLFSPIKIGNVTARNRIVVPGHWSGMRYYPQEFLPDERSVAYWESKAKGGAGIVTMGVWGVHPTAAWYPDPKHPQYLERLKWASDSVKRHGAIFLVQIWHPGLQSSGFKVGQQQWAPSATPTLQGQIPHEMTRDEIGEVIESFAATAARNQKAGIDGVELHGAHGYMLSQFLSPHTNKRTDEYGGSLEGRMRFPLAVIDAVRAAVGSDFVVGLRVNGDMFVPGGYTLDDMVSMAPILAGTGKIDYINISTGGPQVIAPMYFPLGHSVYQAAAIKQVVDNIPVACVGRIVDPVQAETILEQHQADLICMNRATICDPEMPNKARDGRVDDIRKCMGCSEGCWQRVTESTAVTCAYNPTVGKEYIPGWLEMIPAETKKKVMVIGGGPAGLETARVAAARGHDVSLWEKRGELGGLTLLAAKLPGRDGFDELPRY